MKYFRKPLEQCTIFDIQYVLHKHKLKNNKYIRNKLFKAFKEQPSALAEICDKVYDKRIKSWEQSMSHCPEASYFYSVRVMQGKLPDWWHNKMIAASLIKNDYYTDSYFKFIKRRK